MFDCNVQKVMTSNNLVRYDWMDNFSCRDTCTLHSETANIPWAYLFSAILTLLLASSDVLF